METFKIIQNGVEVARLTGDGIAFGRRSNDLGILVDDPKMLRKTVDGHTLFVLMLSSQNNMSVEKVVE